MTLLTQIEFAHMERLMADLLGQCDPQEEVLLLDLHTRLVDIYAAQSGLSRSRDRLRAIAKGG